MTFNISRFLASRRSASREAPDREAIAALRNAAAGSPAAAAEAEAWSLRMPERQIAGEPLTVMETALVYVFRNGLVERRSGPQAHRRIEAVLAKSRLHLAGARGADRGAADRLPRRVLRTAGREVRLLHAAAFQPGGPKAARAWASLGRDYVPEPWDLALASGLAALALTGFGRAVLGSGLLGYAVATVVEYGMHRWGGHEGTKILKPLIRNSGWIGRKISEYLEATYIGHFVVHHVKTSSRNYTSQFSNRPPGDKASVDAELARLGPMGEFIRQTDYGMTINHVGVVAGFAVALPFQLALIWALNLRPWSAVALMAPSVLYVAASKFLHPYLHKTRDVATAGPFMRLLLATRYAEMISRAHWVHHKGGGGNFNLVPGADLLFGDFRRPNLDMVFRMRDDGILGADWDKPGKRLRADPPAVTRV